MKKIMVLDDQPQDILCKLLEKKGYIVNQYFTTEHAFRAYQKEKPNRIICDVDLAGGESGFDFYKIISSDLGSTRFIFSSSFEAYRIQAEGLGVPFFLKGEILKEIAKWE